MSRIQRPLDTLVIFRLIIVLSLPCPFPSLSVSFPCPFLSCSFPSLSFPFLSFPFLVLSFLVLFLPCLFPSVPFPFLVLYLSCPLLSFLFTFLNLSLPCPFPFLFFPFLVLPCPIPFYCPCTSMSSWLCPLELSQIISCPFSLPFPFFYSVSLPKNFIQIFYSILIKWNSTHCSGPIH